MDNGVDKTSNSATPTINLFGGAFEQVKSSAMPNNGQFESLLRQQLMLQQQQRLAMVMALGGGGQFAPNGGQMPFMFAQQNMNGVKYTKYK